MIKTNTEVNKGGICICNEIKNILTWQELEGGTHSPQISRMAERETEIVQNVKKGDTSKEIGLRLQIGLNTVEVHWYNILRKLHLKTLLHLSIILMQMLNDAKGNKNLKHKTFYTSKLWLMKLCIRMLEVGTLSVI